MDDSSGAYLESLLLLKEAVMNNGSDLPLSVITELEEGTRQLQLALTRAKNLHSPSNKLPDEVLELIFELRRPQYDDFLPCWPSDRMLRECLSITHICRRWRRVALGLPLLWSTIDLCHDRSLLAARAFLERSGDRPLTVFYSMPDMFGSGEDSVVLGEIMDYESARLEQLHVTADTDYDFLQVPRLFDVAAPKLYSLSLCVRCPDDPERLIQARPLFDGQCPGVRKLAVVNCPVWDSHTFSDLTHLALYHTHYNADAVQDILRSADLEELIVTDVDMRDFGRSAASIPLPRLQNLQLDMQVLAHDTSSLVSRLDIPASCRCRVAHTDWQDVMSVTSAPFFHPFQDGIHTVQLLLNGPPRMLMTIAHGVLSMECSGNDVASLAGRLHPSSELVVVFRHGAASEEDWTGLLSPMLQVRSLVIADHPEGRYGYASRITPLIDVLGSPASHTGVPDLDGQTAHVLPSLESVHVHGASVDVWPSLWSVVSQRARAGTPLQELSIYNDPVDSDTPGTIRTVSLDTSGLASRVTTKESFMSAADIMAKINHGLKPRRPVNGLAWARRER
ncbi:hypothetical protein FB107DRAFT_272287 [Schizophyllum commune]